MAIMVTAKVESSKAASSVWNVYWNLIHMSWHRDWKKRRRGGREWEGEREKSIAITFLGDETCLCLQFCCCGLLYRDAVTNSKSILPQDWSAAGQATSTSNKFDKSRSRVSVMPVPISRLRTSLPIEFVWESTRRRPTVRRRRRTTTHHAIMHCYQSLVQIIYFGFA